MLRARQLPLVALTCAALAGCHALAGYQSTDGAALPDALADAPARPVDLPGQLVDIAPVDMPRDAVDDTVARDASARDAAARDGKLSTTDTTLQMSDGATIGVDKGLVTPCTKDADCMPLRCCNARCVDTRIDPKHCGQCNMICGAVTPNCCGSKCYANPTPC